MTASEFRRWCPRLCGLARYAATNRQEIVDAAIEDVPKMGWHAPYTLLRLVNIVVAGRDDPAAHIHGFDDRGDGPFCGHGYIDVICPTCGAWRRAADLLVDEVERLAMGKAA